MTGADRQEVSSRLPQLPSDVWSERSILSEAQELGHVGAWAWQLANDQLWWSDEMYRIFGFEPQSFVPSYDDYLRAVSDDDRAMVTERVQQALAAGADFDVQHRLTQPTGRVVYVRQRGRIARDDMGRPLRLLGSVLDVTNDVLMQQERDRALQALAESEARHRLLAENAWDVIWTMDIDGAITYVSPSVERVRGLTPAEAAVQPLDEMMTPDSVAKVLDYYAKLYAAIEAGTAPPIYHGEREYYRKDGSIMLGELQVIPQVDGDGKVVQILGVTRDISERRRLEEELNRLAITDPLTGVWNRRETEALIESEIDHPPRYRSAVTLLMLDIDHFKLVNDERGHQAGDRVLIELTALLSANLRTSDTLGRWGGEEFVMLLRECTLAQGLHIAEKLRTLVAEAHFDGRQVTVSIGAAQHESHEAVDTWLVRADQAMYQAKAAGRNRVMASA